MYKGRTSRRVVRTAGGARRKKRIKRGCAAKMTGREEMDKGREEEGNERREVSEE